MMVQIWQCVSLAFVLVATQAFLIEDVRQSCAGRCGNTMSSSNSCQCNTHCVRFNDCCPDYNTVCSDTPATCQSRCGARTNSSLPCQCNTYCTKYHDCCIDYKAVCQGVQTTTRTTTTTASTTTTSTTTTKPTTTTTTTTTESSICKSSSMAAVTEVLWASDVNRMTSQDIWVSLQSRVRDIFSMSNATDASQNKLFRYVNTDKLRTGTYAKFRALRDNYEPRKGRKEWSSDLEAREESDFLTAVMDTGVMRLLYDYVRCQGLVHTKSQFRQKLWTTWFKLYARSGRGTEDTNAFEHLMLGEYKYYPEQLVNGYHNWISFYEDKAAHELNYYGYVSKVDSIWLIGAAFVWNNFYKSKGTFLVGVSPEFDLALYSLCFWFHADERCYVSLGGKHLIVRSYTTDSHLATAFID